MHIYIYICNKYKLNKHVNGNGSAVRLRLQKGVRNIIQKRKKITSGKCILKQCIIL